MFELTFDTANDAFADDPAEECVRILRLVASQIDRGARSGSVLDVNGNRVGSWHQ